MKRIKKLLSLLFVFALVLIIAAPSVLAGTYNLSDSDSTPIKNASGTSYNCTLVMKSTVTGGIDSIIGGYTVSSKGTLTGLYPGINPSYCEKIKYENTYTFSVIGAITLTVGTSGGSVSGSTSSTSRTVSETYSKTNYPQLYKLNETISCKAQCWDINWHYQSASVTYTIMVAGNPVSASCSTADNTVIW